MQAFVVITAQCFSGHVTVAPPKVVFDRQAAYRYYHDNGGGKIPRGHKIETLETKSNGGATHLYIVDIPDRKKYDKTFILDLVRRILAGEISQMEASRLYGPSQSTISQWVRLHAEEVRGN